MATDVVVALTADCHGSGRNITSDDYFTDLKLAESFLKNKLTYVGANSMIKSSPPPPPLGESKFL